MQPSPSADSPLLTDTLRWLPSDYAPKVADVAVKRYQWLRDTLVRGLEVGDSLAVCKAAEGIGYALQHRYRLPEADLPWLVTTLYELATDTHVDAEVQQAARTAFENIVQEQRHALRQVPVYLDWRRMYRYFDEQFASGTELVRGKLNAAVSSEAQQATTMCGMATQLFPGSAVREIVDALLPRCVPHTTDGMTSAAMMFSLLPVRSKTGVDWNRDAMEPIMKLWKTVSDTRTWDAMWMMITLQFTDVRPHVVNWEPHLRFLYSRILESARIATGGARMPQPVAHRIPRETQAHLAELSGEIGYTAGTLIVFTMMPGNSGLPLFRQLWATIKTYFHPSNTGPWSKYLADMLEAICEALIVRLRLERRPVETHKQCKWPVEFRLTNAMVGELVMHVKDVALMALHSKSGSMSMAASKSLRVIAQIAPYRVLPTLLQDHVFNQLQSLTSTHHASTALTVLSSVAVVLTQRSVFPHGVRYLPDLLRLTLPGIDPNDTNKTRLTLTLYFNLLNCIPMRDASGTEAVTNAAGAFNVPVVLDDNPSVEDMDLEPTAEVPLSPSRAAALAASSAPEPNINVMMMWGASEPIGSMHGGTMSHFGGASAGSAHAARLQPPSDEEVRELDVERRELVANIGDWCMQLMDRMFALWDVIEAPVKKGSRDLQGYADRATTEVSNVMFTTMFAQASDELHNTLLRRAMAAVMGKPLPHAHKQCGKMLQGACMRRPEETLAVVMPQVLSPLLMAIDSGQSAATAKAAKAAAAQAAAASTDDGKKEESSAGEGNHFQDIDDQEVLWWINIVRHTVRRAGTAVLPFVDRLRAVINAALADGRRPVIKAGGRLLRSLLATLTTYWIDDWSSLTPGERSSCAEHGDSWSLWGRTYKIADAHSSWHCPSDAELRVAAELADVYIGGALARLAESLRVQKQSVGSNSSNSTAKVRRQRWSDLHAVRSAIKGVSVRLRSGTGAAEDTPAWERDYAGVPWWSPKRECYLHHDGRLLPTELSRLSICAGLTELLTLANEAAPDESQTVLMLMKVSSVAMTWMGASSSKLSMREYALSSLRRSIKNNLHRKHHLRVLLLNKVVTSHLNHVFEGTRHRMYVPEHRALVEALLPWSLVPYAKVRGRAHHVIYIIVNSVYKKALWDFYPRFLSNALRFEAEIDEMRGALAMLRNHFLLPRVMPSRSRQWRRFAEMLETLVRLRGHTHHETVKTVHATIVYVLSYFSQQLAPVVVYNPADVLTSDVRERVAELAKAVMETRDRAADGDPERAQRRLVPAQQQMVTDGFRRCVSLLIQAIHDADKPLPQDELEAAVQAALKSAGPAAMAAAAAGGERGREAMVRAAAEMARSNSWRHQLWMTTALRMLVRAPPHAMDRPVVAWFVECLKHDVESMRRAGMTALFATLTYARKKQPFYTDALHRSPGQLYQPSQADVRVDWQAVEFPATSEQWQKTAFVDDLRQGYAVEGGQPGAPPMPSGIYRGDRSALWAEGELGAQMSDVSPLFEALADSAARRRLLAHFAEDHKIATTGGGQGGGRNTGRTNQERMPAVVQSVVTIEPSSAGLTRVDARQRNEDPIIASYLRLMTVARRSFPRTDPVTFGGSAALFSRRRGLFHKRIVQAAGPDDSARLAVCADVLADAFAAVREAIVLHGQRKSSKRSGGGGGGGDSDGMDVAAVTDASSGATDGSAAESGGSADVVTDVELAQRWVVLCEVWAGTGRAMRKWGPMEEDGESDSQPVHRLRRLLRQVFEWALEECPLSIFVDWRTAVRFVMTNSDPRRTRWIVEPLLRILEEQGGDGGGGGEEGDADMDVAGSSSTGAGHSSEEMKRSVRALSMLRTYVVEASWRLPLMERIYRQLVNRMMHESKHVRDEVVMTLWPLMLLTNAPSQRQMSLTGAQLAQRWVDHLVETEQRLRDAGEASTQQLRRFLHSKLGTMTLMMYTRLPGVLEPHLDRLLPGVFQLLTESATDQADIVRYARGVLALVAMGADVATLSTALDAVVQAENWHVRSAVLPFMQLLAFNGRFSDPTVVVKVHELVVGRLVDSQVEVRQMAGSALTSLLRGSNLTTLERMLTVFLDMAGTKVHVSKKRRQLTGSIDALPATETAAAAAAAVAKVPGETGAISASEQARRLRRHGGVLGLAAVVASDPYEVPPWMPAALTELAKHSSDPLVLVQGTVRRALAEFWRTHHDRWRDFKPLFSREQLDILEERMLPPSYLA